MIALGSRVTTGEKEPGREVVIERLSKKNDSENEKKFLKEGIQWCFPRGDDKLDEFEGSNKGGCGDVIWSMTQPGGSWSNRQPLASGGLKSNKRDETIIEMMKMKVFRMGWG